MKVRVSLSAPQVRTLLNALEQVEPEMVGEESPSEIGQIRRLIYAAVWDTALPKMDMQKAA